MRYERAIKKAIGRAQKEQEDMLIVFDDDYHTYQVIASKDFTEPQDGGYFETDIVAYVTPNLILG